MSKLDINTNGSWRLVIGDVGPSIAEAVKQACVDITAAAAQVSSARAAPSWRLRDALGHVYLYCECSTKTGITAWRETARGPAQGDML